MPRTARYATDMQPGGTGSLTLGLALLLTALGHGPVAAQSSKLRALIREVEGKGAHCGVAVCDDTGRVLFRHRAAEVFAPASNMKLLTACALLHGLGIDYRFHTPFHLVDGVLQVEASGDPNWIRDTEHAGAQVFDHVARALLRRGVRGVRGIELRSGTFVGPARPADWPKDQLYTYYCAPTGPFVLDQGVFWMAVDPDLGGPRATLLSPAAGYPVDGAITITARRGDARYGALDRGGRVQVRGKVWRKAPRVEIRQSVDDPTRWYQDTLVARLEAAGIAIAADAPASNQIAFYVHTSPLRAALARLLQESSNFDAEQCLRVLGHELLDDGSLAGGMRAMQAQVEQLCQRLPDGAALVDGSGLSRSNRLTPGLMVVAMWQNSRTANGHALQELLPIAGRTGTLDDRFLGTDLVGRVFAKTGWIRGASSLSGVVVTETGARRWFSILMSYDKNRGGFNKTLQAAQEAICAAIDGMEADQ